jgi:DNA-binding response OmpR family regulator
VAKEAAVPHSENLAPPEPPKTQPMQVDVPKTTERIVLAEDDPNTRMMVKFFLQQQGYEVVLASDGEEALEKIRAERPDMVILDVNMPRKDGFAVCKEMRSRMDTMFTPVIMLTAQSSIEAKLQGLSLGADDYVTKPIHPAELAARIEVILRRAYMHEVVSSE